MIRLALWQPRRSGNGRIELTLLNVGPIIYLSIKYHKNETAMMLKSQRNGVIVGLKKARSVSRVPLPPSLSTVHCTSLSSTYVICPYLLLYFTQVRHLPLSPRLYLLCASGTFPLPRPYLLCIAHKYVIWYFPSPPSLSTLYFTQVRHLVHISSSHLVLCFMFSHKIFFL